jgi:Zn-dependent peptidase ImmA (M78 family)
VTALRLVTGAGGPAPDRDLEALHRLVPGPARATIEHSAESAVSGAESWSPWRHLRENHPDVVVYEHEMPDGYLGCVDPDRGIIWLDSRLTQAERRSVLTHELGHLERGPAPAGEHADPVEERAVDVWAARMLITIPDLAAALGWSSHLSEIAEELWVSVHMLTVRLETMSQAELMLLARLRSATRRRRRRARYAAYDKSQTVDMVKAMDEAWGAEQ